MSNIAVITARGGSKRIPRKNIKPFRGKPIIAYSIEAAITSRLFNFVMVSTDDEEIADIAKTYGAEIPFFRSASTSDDFSGTSEVLFEVLSELKKIGKQFDNLCCIYPTAPLLLPETLKAAYDFFVNNKYTTVFPVGAYSTPILRAFQVNQNGKISMLWPENFDKRSQDLETTYYDAGQFYWTKTCDFLESKKLFTDNSGAIILNELQVQDIDTESDWKLAEMKHAMLCNDISRSNNQT